MANAKDVYKMHLNEVMELGDAYWRRVPGGWIVTETYTAPGESPGPFSLRRLHPVFVPMPSEPDEVSGTGPPIRIHLTNPSPAKDTGAPQAPPPTDDEDDGPGF